MEILIIVLLILLNGIFSMSEIALVSSKKFKLENAAKNGNKKAKIAFDLASNPNTFLATVQIGITLIGILTGVFSGEKITTDLEQTIKSVPFLAPYAHTIAVIIIVFILTYLSIVVGELIPKRIGLLFPEKIAMTVAAPMNIISKITAPFIWLLTGTNDFVLRLFGIKGNMESAVTEEEIKAMIQSSTDGGDIQEIEQNIVERVFDLGDRRVSELMTHRSDVIWFDINDSLETVRSKAKEGVHAIYPVGGKSLDNILGILSLKELFPKDLDKDTFKISDYIKKPLIVHLKTPAYKVLEKFREHKSHFALVVDEYGSVQGLVSMDDMLDALVGNLSDHDDDEYRIIKRSDDSWLVDGQFPYFELLNYFELSDYEANDSDFNTIAGLILHLRGQVPAVGDKTEWRNFELEVVDMDGLRIDKILITFKGDVQ